MLQRTVAKSVKVVGIGIHSGRKVTLTMHPARANHGITFDRTDLPAFPLIQASVNVVGATEQNTTLGSGENVVHTVEHLLAVLYGLGINNVRCEIDGPEVPIMDGSGAAFVFLLKETGVEILHEPKNFMIILDTVRVEHGDKWATIEPANRLEIEASIIFPHPVIKKQTKKFDFSCENFVQEICRARTFGLLKDVDMLKRRGLIKGGSLDNAVVLDDYNVVNPEGLRFEDEFVRHKILDTIGDIGLLGHEIVGKVTTFKSGHYLHNKLCRKLLDTPNAYKIVSAAQLQQQEALLAFELPMAISSSYH